MSGDGKTAADIVHDTFIDACRRAPRMRDHLYLSSWLYGAARRRCVRRGRAKVLFWDRDAEFSEIPFLDRAEPDGPVPEWPPAEELHELLRGSLARLAPVDQEVVLLAFRHGLRPARLGATLGLSSRRTAMRVRRGRAELEAALQRELDRAGRACVEGRPEEEVPATAIPVLAARGAVVREEEPPVPAKAAGRGRRRAFRRRGEDSPADPSADLHAAGCAACRRRARVTAAALLRRAPAPILPAALRHRVMHTATDPELARLPRRHRGARRDAHPVRPAEPAGRAVAVHPPVDVHRGRDGGRAGRRPGGGVRDGARHQREHAVVAAVPHASAAVDHAGEAARRPVPRQGRAGGLGRCRAGAPRPGAAEPADRGEPGQSRGSSPSPTQPTRPPEKRGVLVVNPAKVELYGTKTAKVDLAAEQGPVTWTAMTSSNQLILSEMQGGMPEDGTTRLTLTLRTALIGLPGQGTITFTDSEGASHEVKVVWGATIL
ncbi:sigma-70 family RNA polymerase sigma factor [Actinomadura madurae]|nr:sigma-70 family RNA polymerase sigma factor [Actinomadura madurae]